MAAKDFIDQLKALKLDVQEVGDGKIVVPYVIPVGPKSGQVVKLGFIAFGDFPTNPPGCLPISPHLLPINTSGGTHPNATLNENPTFRID